MKIIIIFPLFIFTLSGCTSSLLRTTNFPETLYKPKANFESSPKIPSPRIGIPYYLPTTLIPITITTDDGGTSSSNNAAPTATPSNTTIIINPPASPSKDGGSSSSLLSKKVGPYKITIGAPILAPDTSQIFFLEYNSSFATEDALTFGVGPNQLLESVNAKSIDQSGEALVTLAKIAADLAFVASGAKTTEKSETPNTSCSADNSVNVSTYLDPTLTPPVDKTVPFSVAALKAILDEKKIRLDIGSTAFPHTDATSKVIEDEEKIEKDIKQEILEITKRKIEHKKGGVLFRVPAAYELKVTLENVSGCKDDQLRMMVMAPSKELTYSIDVTRGALITKTTNLTISNGMLTKIEVNKPSSLLGVLNVPLNVLKAILSAPAELFTLKIQQIKDEGAISQAKADKYESQITEIKNAILLQKAQHPSP